MFDKFKSFLKEIKLLSVEKKQRLMNLVLRLSNLVLVNLALWKKKSYKCILDTIVIRIVD